MEAWSGTGANPVQLATVEAWIAGAATAATQRGRAVRSVAKRRDDAAATQARRKGRGVHVQRYLRRPPCFDASSVDPQPPTRAPRRRGVARTSLRTCACARPVPGSSEWITTPISTTIGRLRLRCREQADRAPGRGRATASLTRILRRWWWYRSARSIRRGTATCSSDRMTLEREAPAPARRASRRISLWSGPCDGDSFESGVDAEGLKETADVVPDRLGAQVELGGDLLRRAALLQKTEHLDLTGREMRGRRCGSCRRGVLRSARRRRQPSHRS